MTLAQAQGGFPVREKLGKTVARRGKIGQPVLVGDESVSENTQSEKVLQKVKLVLSKQEKPISAVKLGEKIDLNIYNLRKHLRNFYFDGEIVRCKAPDNPRKYLWSLKRETK